MRVLINLLRQTLKPHLGWHGARLNFLALFLIALLRVKTINLTELAIGFRSQSQINSSYKRLQRFFRNFDLDYAVIAQAIFEHHGHPAAVGFKHRSNRVVFWANSVQHFDAWHSS